jgi:hypothetical protein
MKSGKISVKVYEFVHAEAEVHDVVRTAIVAYLPFQSIVAEEKEYPGESVRVHAS